MKNRAAAATHARISAGVIAAFLLLSGWCGSAAGSSGLPVLCNPAEDTLPSTDITASTSSLTTHEDSNPHENIDGDDVTIQVSRPAMAESVNESLVEDIEDVGTSDGAEFEFSKIPGIATHLPGVPESALPRFRRQMYRTDI